MAVIFLEELESAGGALLDRGGKPERPTMPWLSRDACCSSL
jgi:hypothetical protein